MAKKKLSIKSKLNINTPSDNDLNLIKKTSTYPKSYRWKKHDLEIIKSLVEQTNYVSKNYKVGAINLLRGALLLARKQKPEKLLKLIIEAEKESRISGL
jgi:hypothetical protein